MASAVVEMAAVATVAEKAGVVMEVAARVVDLAAAMGVVETEEG